MGNFCASILCGYHTPFAGTIGLIWRRRSRAYKGRIEIDFTTKIKHRASSIRSTLHGKEHGNEHVDLTDAGASGREELIRIWGDFNEALVFYDAVNVLLRFGAFPNNRNFGVHV